MKPFFPFFGSKHRIAKHYGAPRYDLVIEPFAGSHPNKRPGKWWAKYRHDSQCRVWSESARARIASQVHKIRHWEVAQASYAALGNGPAHWFIDPPYSVAGHKYRGAQPDYAALAAWCQTREGFVQVCENEGAEWLPFNHFRAVRGMKKSSVEALYQVGA